eukprot:GCRY01003140.1.p1 GENE.GCRY01003140.1~~GCRY01003140.1.p1  ORF type:complete len:174 (+),score=32.32 GCRY01003140.1:979-1500(+)
MVQLKRRVAIFPLAICFHPPAALLCFPLSSRPSTPYGALLLLITQSPLSRQNQFGGRGRTGLPTPSTFRPLCATGFLFLQRSCGPSPPSQRGTARLILLPPLCPYSLPPNNPLIHAVNIHIQPYPGGQTDTLLSPLKTSQTLPHSALFYFLFFSLGVSIFRTLLSARLAPSPQ